MASCKDCVHVEACSRKQKSVIDGLNRAAQYAEKFTNEKIEVGCSKEESLCELFCDRSRFVELPQSVHLCDAVYFVLKDLDEIDLQEYTFTVGKNAVSDTVQFITEIGTYGFWVGESPREFATDYDDFYHWYELGETVFLSREAAEQALKERELNE